ncbi:MAG: YHS domain-containing protein [Candidatus Omnitrophota bacterium]
MKKYIGLLIAAVIIAGGVIVFGVYPGPYTGLYAGRCCGSIAKAAEQGEVVNDKCPVMGGTVDKNTAYTADYKGQKIGFCCPECQKKFNANPEKYYNIP